MKPSSDTYGHEETRPDTYSPKEPCPDTFSQVVACPDTCNYEGADPYTYRQVGASRENELVRSHTDRWRQIRTSKPKNVLVQTPTATRKLVRTLKPPGSGPQSLCQGYSWLYGSGPVPTRLTMTVTFSSWLLHCGCWSPDKLTLGVRCPDQTPLVNVSPDNLPLALYKCRLPHGCGSPGQLSCVCTYPDKVPRCCTYPE